MERISVHAEGLDLRYADAGVYELVCLPLKLKGADGAPARMVLAAYRRAQTSAQSSLVYAQ